MDLTLLAAEMSVPSLVLRYAAAFFFVLVAIALAYALFKAAKALERLDKVLADVDENGIPLMTKAGDTLDGVNANLTNVDEITKDVAAITDKIDTMATAVEGAVTTPARKAAAFSAGVQSAVSSFMRRDKGTDAPVPGSSDEAPAGGWSYAAAEAAQAAAEEAAASQQTSAAAGAQTAAPAADTSSEGGANATVAAAADDAHPAADAAGTTPAAGDASPGEG